LKKGFNGSPVINGIDLKVKSGERIAIIGPNGAGKSTLFRLFNLTLSPDQGELAIDGVKVNRLSGKELNGLRRRIATIYQHNNLIPRFKVIHNVLSGRLGDWSTSKALFSLMVKPQEEEMAHDILDNLGIVDKAYWRTDRLSGGQQQWVTIARALMQNPDIILADEPCSSLDPRNGEKLIKLLVELNGRIHKTLIVNLHRVDYALAYFPRTIGIKEGKVFFDLQSEKVSKDLLQDLYRDEEPREVEQSEKIKIPYCCIPPVKI
jgi:phosphonate transport system ATP-binding protein